MTLETRDEWAISEVARLTGTTSRTLRHYQAEGLLEPSRVGANGYRYYDAHALVRLQRILLLRSLGLGIDAIRDALAGEPDTAAALRTHLGWLRQEQDRLARRIAAVEHTIGIEEGGGRVVAEKMFDGFDHTRYKDEVEQRWGADAYATSDAWWRGMSDNDRADWRATSEALARAWMEAAESGTSPDSDEAQQLAERQVEWLSAIPGTPRAADGSLDEDYLRGLGDMYAADDRFAANYGGTEGARFVRDTLNAWIERHP
ncbi:MerR family transcriptional regulator [Herbiconiux sp. L3-i23]|uniref:MerR family transcriptional regulator n=1 Tax=Herbiconiux sp. L3-i23 TaxID=2905871 RepID=UPI00206F1AE0|nr:MerR family transcriptional regulator [Herbiconiux sp. L3-i23]BDI23123.1 MerR family transcriptional regulator [Herbiconiux sp. L3-i23]